MNNPIMAQAISQNPTFSAIANEVAVLRDQQAIKYEYSYSVAGSVVGQQTLPFNIQIEQGVDFKLTKVTGSAFSYDAGNATDFPIPNSAGNTAWAGRGLVISITDTRSGRNLTSGFINFENFFSPGYGQNFQSALDRKNFFYRNTKIRFDIRNRDNANRTHEFEIVYHGYKYVTPNMA